MDDPALGGIGSHPMNGRQEEGMVGDDQVSLHRYCLINHAGDRIDSEEHAPHRRRWITANETDGIPR